MQTEKVSLETLGYVKNKSAVVVAYRNYLDKKPNSEDKFYEAVAKFARGKITTRLFDSPEATSDIEDYVQEVVVKVWDNLGSFNGGAESFYHWLHKICYMHGLAAAISIRKEFTKRADLFVESEDGDMEDNPLIYNGEVIHEHAREIPEFIQGADLLICKLIRHGHNYKEVGIELGLTEKAVEHRVDRIYKKVEAQNLPQQRADFLAEQDRLWAEANGPIVRGSLKSDGPCDDWANWYQGQVAEARAKYGV